MSKVYLCTAIPYVNGDPHIGHAMDYLLAALACHFKEYAYASKAVSNILASRTVDRRMKDKALDLKEMIVKGNKEESEQ